MADTEPCPVCKKDFVPVVRGGHKKKFCSKACKQTFETASRQYAYAMIDAGLLTVEDILRVSASRATRQHPTTPANAAE